MLKLIYDVRCGFKELYMTEKNVEFDLTSIIESWKEDGELEFDHEIEFDQKQSYQALDEDETYNVLKDYTQAELEEYFTDNGILDCICEFTELDYAKTYFKDICYGGTDHFVPGYTKVFNLRLSRSEGEEPDKISNKTNIGLKAEEVMAVLGISRQTLSNWVKRGLIEAKKTATGRYVYNAESVYKLKESK